MEKNQLIQFLQVNKIWAKKSMGQNFLVDETVLEKIVVAAELKLSDTVVEIGPGLGILTEELAKRAGRVVAVEKDDELASKLNDKFLISTHSTSSGQDSKLNSKFQNSNVQIINQDILNIQNSEFSIHNSGFKVVANIPYNITSKIIRKFLEAKIKPELMVLLVQKEVAERIVAKVGEMSLLSVSVQFYAQPEIIDIVPAEAFFPVPKVDSAIIKLRIKNSELRIKGRDLFRIIKFGFASKRKTLENNLAAGMHISKAEASDIIKKTGLSEKIRAQDLSIDDWKKLFYHSGLDGIHY